MTGNPVIPAEAGSGDVGLLQAGSARISTETLGTSQWLLELRDWQYEPAFFETLSDLASRSGTANPFYEPEFLNASHSRTGPQDRKMLVLWECIDGSHTAKLAFPVGEDVAGIPPHRAWRAENTPYAPLGMPLIDEIDFDETVERFANLCRELPDFREKPLLFEDFPISSVQGRRFVALLASAGFHTATAAPIQRASLTATGGLTKFSSKQRHELGRQMRKLGELGTASFEDAEEFWEVMARFEEFLVLETRGWKGRKGTSIHILRKTASFARQTVAALADRGRATIHTLRIDGQAIASLIVLRSGGSYFPWKTAFKEDFRRFSPGKHLMLHTTRWMQARQGFQMADSLAREASWMDRLWSEKLELCSLVISTADGAGQADRLAQAIDRKVWAKHRLKQLLNK